jgi:hypothetical protein
MKYKTINGMDYRFSQNQANGFLVVVSNGYREIFAFNVILQPVGDDLKLPEYLVAPNVCVPMFVSEALPEISGYLKSYVNKNIVN